MASYELKGGIPMKRLLAVLLIISMSAVWLLVPVQAVPSSGTCGENMTWTYDEATHRLTVTGTGPMAFEDYPRWRDLDDKITSVAIEEGVTSIAYSAFSGFQKLHTVILPDSVKTIEDNAFSDCWKLTNISLDYVTALGDYSFSQCSAMEELIVPAGVTEIPWGAFSDCQGLQKVIFHENVKTIENYAFSGCTGLTSVDIPNSVTTLGSLAFQGCMGLETVNLGSGITELTNAVFSDCVSLESFRIPDSVTSIQSDAFRGCTALKEVYLGVEVADIAASAFWKCPMLKAFSLSDQNPHFSLDRGVLYSKDRKALVRFPYGFTGAYTVLPETTEIQEYAGYETGITALTIPGNVKRVGSDAFSWCENLVTLRLSEGLDKLEGAFDYTGLQKVTIPASVTEIGAAFMGCINMKQMVIHGDPPAISQRAFPDVDFQVFYPKKTNAWLKAHDLYGGLPSWELQCATHSFTDGACSRCGVSDPKAADLTGELEVAGDDYAVTEVQLYREGKPDALRTYSTPVGQYLFPEILPGKYTLRVSAEGFVTREYTVNAVSGTVNCDLRLHALGDTNGDGKINVSEVSRIYAHTKETAMLEGYALACADIKQDGKLNVADVSKLYAQVQNG